MDKQDNQMVYENTNNRQPYQMMVLPQDPIAFLVMAPFLPLMLLFQGMAMMQMPMMPRTMYSEQPRTKVTSITRTGNTLDIIEKWM